MGQRFGHDFSRVRVHSGGAAEQSARDVNANAYTVGHNIVFGAGRFAPGTHEGRRLIAHELTHVVQQSGADGIREEKHGLFPIYPASQLRRDPEKNDVEKRKKDDWGGKTLPQDKKLGLATSLFQDIGVTPVKSFGSVAGAKFLLHDTSGASSRAHIEAEAKKAGGPLRERSKRICSPTGLEVIQRP